MGGTLDTGVLEFPLLFLLFDLLIDVGPALGGKAKKDTRWRGFLQCGSGRLARVCYNSLAYTPGFRTVYSFVSFLYKLLVDSFSLLLRFSVAITADC